MNLDDPKLTAYALNELTDPVETAEVETWLEGHAEGRTFVIETRETAAFLSAQLHSTSAIELTDEQRATILGDRVVQFPNRRKQWSVIGLAALAACLAVGPLLPWTELLRLRDSAAPTLAVNEKPMTLQMPIDEGKSAQPPAPDRSLAAGNDALAPEPLELALSTDRPSALRRAPLVQEELKKANMASAKAEAEANPSSSSTEVAKEIADAQPVFAASKPVGDTVDAKFKDAADKMGSLSAIAGAKIPLPAETPARADGDVGISRGGAVAKTNDGQLNETRSRTIWSVDKSWERPAARRLSKQAAAGDARAVTAGNRSGSAALDAAAVDALLFGSTDNKDRDQSEKANTEAYDSITENDFLTARENPLSTFSIDVDTASYANVRRFLNDGQLPPKGAVRIEEMLNYFSYDYAKPEGDAPFSTNLEVADCPWQPEHRLVRIGLRGKEVDVAERKAANLVFLIDVSGSMDEPNKLPLLKQSLRLLVDQLGENDKVALTVYAGSSGLVLPSTANKEAIRSALENLQPGGSTNGASGIELAYQQAAANFIKDGVNRVILATDGDFNVGVTNQSDLVDLITAKAKTGVFLSVLGFGTGNVKDSTMEKLADKGNGNYAYIDGIREGKKVLVEQMGGTLVTIAKDVKIQVEFNPAVVGSYRLIGYENRALKKEDFADDKKDAGEIGSGHTVTALYEVVMVGTISPVVKTEPLKYSNNVQAPALPSGDMLTVKLRYKEPAGEVSKKLEFPLTDNGGKMASASADFRFASAVAEVGQLLRQSEHQQLASWESALSRASEAKGEDRGGYRAEFIELMKRAQQLVERKG